ncbi:MAG: tetratricopeptide repeat protein [Candidatus Omnitrophica bacterium]|nr:tetratricopeptide repeat protein [Candidatus Omnitrophota bacterium]
MLRLIILLFLIFLPFSVSADRIILKSGKTIDAKILERADGYIKIDFSGTPLTYYHEQIETVLPATETPVPDSTLTGDTYFQEGKRCYEQRKYQEALYNFTKSTKLNPSHSETYLWAGFVNARLNNHNKAINLYTKVLELNPDSYRAYKNIAISYFYVNDIDKAVDCMERAISLTPEEEKEYLLYCYNWLAYFYGNSGKQEKSINFYKKAIELGPKYADSYINLGNMYKSLGRREDAIIEFDKAGGLLSDDFSTTFRLVNSYLGIGEYQKAITILKDLLSEYPDNSRVIASLGNAYMLAGNYGDAINYLLKAAEYDPKNYNIYITLGDIYNHIGKRKEALSAFDTAIALNPDIARARMGRGAVLIYFGQHRPAIESLSKAIIIDPDLAKAYAYRGIAYSILAEHGNAKQDFRKAVDLDPSIYEILKELYIFNEPTSEETGNNIMYRSRRGHFCFLIPKGWTKVPDDEFEKLKDMLIENQDFLKYLKDSINDQFSPDNDEDYKAIEYIDALFQKKESPVTLSMPFVCVSVNDKTRVGEDLIYDLISEAGSDSPFVINYDKRKKILKVTFPSRRLGLIGNIRTEVFVILSKYGNAYFELTSPENSYHDDSEDFSKMIDTFKFDRGYEYDKSQLETGMVNIDTPNNTFKNRGLFLLVIGLLCVLGVYMFKKKC